MSKTKASKSKEQEAEAAEPVDNRSLFQRLHEALGPILGGMILDAVDFATFGPIGFYLGPIAGAVAGLWIASIYKFSKKGRILFMILAAVYCAIPFTSPFPLATFVSAAARFLGTGRSARKES